MIPAAVHMILVAVLCHLLVYHLRTLCTLQIQTFHHRNMIVIYQQNLIHHINHGILIMCTQMIHHFNIVKKPPIGLYRKHSYNNMQILSIIWQFHNKL
uniref:Putative secreted protein n=1 Tax=Panstrongylus lignarius TaxID=156445 RepID=A0A224XR21_9HEMI